MIDFFIAQYKNASNTQIFLEFVAFIFGIASVYCAKKEHILVYPLGLISTVITVYLLYQAHYFGDMTINIYYSVMSIFGWYKWTQKIEETPIAISRTNLKQRWIGFGLFIFTVVIA